MFGFAQSVTIGSGNNVNTTTSSSPINIWYRRTVAQMVYTAAEINAMGVIGAGDLNKLGFKIYQKPIYDIPGYSIKIKHTTATTANNNFGTNGWTTVVNPFTYSPTEGGFDMLNFDTPFAWNGSDNIVVQVCWSQVQPDYNASGQCFVFTSNNGYAYRWTDAAGNSCGATPNSTYNFKPQVELVFDTITVWNGSVSTDWFNADNWSAGVPNEKIDAQIPAGTPNNPNLTASGSCEEFILDGEFQMASTGSLNVYSHFTNSGTYTDNGGVLSLLGKNASNMNINNSVVLNDLSINKPQTVNLTGGELVIENELQILKGSLNTNNNIVINSDAVKTGRIDELHATCTYTLNMLDSWGDGWNGGYLTVYIDGLFLDNFSASGNGSTETFEVSSGQVIDLVYTSGSWENENTYELLNPDNSVAFSDGPNPSTGLVFNMTSACDFSGNYPIQGEITMERYIDAGETYWRFFSSAVQGATIGDYQDDFITAGYPGSPFPNFGWVSIYTYDETLPSGSGYLPVSSSAQSIQTSQGLYVWSGDTITGTQPFLVDLKGVPNQGDIVFPVTYTNTGNPNEDGWNLVGNPYPSTIDWDSPNWTKTNIANALQILNPDSQQYATYVNGASTNGGSRYIASQQAFWIYANGASPSLVAKESVKSAVDQPFFKANEISPGMNIKVSGNNMSDECVLRHVEGTTQNFDSEFDAYKLYGSAGNYPYISVLNDLNQEFSVQTFDKQFEEWSVPLKVIVFQSGIYNLEFFNVQELDVPCLNLEDTYTGQVYAVEENQPISINLSDTTTQARFILHVGRNYEVQSNSVSCSGLSDGSVQLDLDVSGNVNYTVSSNSSVINANGFANPLTISDLAAGSYLISVPSLVNQCGQTGFTIVVPSPLPISVLGSVIDEEQSASNGSVELTINGGNPPYQVLWSNGHTTENIVDLSAGIYGVQITDVNNCKWEGEFEVNSFLSIEENSIISKQIYFDFNQKQLNFIGFENDYNTLAIVYNANGQIVEQFNLDADNHQLTTKLARGVYFVEVSGETYKFIY